MQWLGRIAEVGLAVLIYRLIPALIIAWQTAGAAVSRPPAPPRRRGRRPTCRCQRHRQRGQTATAFAVLRHHRLGDRDVAVGKFEIVRKAGIFMVEVLMKGIEHLRFQWEVFAAIFTSDTIAKPPSATNSGSRR